MDVKVPAWLEKLERWTEDDGMVPREWGEWEA